MKKSSKHHIVPEMILQNFAPKGKLVWVVRKNDPMRLFQQSAAKCSRETGKYRSEFLPNPNQVEQALSRIESNFNHVVRKAIEVDPDSPPSEPLSEQDRMAAIAFFHVALVRPPEWVQCAKKRFSKLPDNANDIHVYSLDLSISEAKEAQKRGGPLPNHGWIIKTLWKCRPSVVLVREGEGCFITGYSPVVKMESSSGLFHNTATPAFITPLSPKRAFVLAPPTFLIDKERTSEWMRRLINTTNALIWDQSETIIAHDKGLLRQVIQKF